ncbi:MAG: UvrD-helicase domain-containing protein [Actinobacteria bacterium]|nr:UvrD-helicase domain-containing protein [Actinomycetota bacterium]
MAIRLTDLQVVAAASDRPFINIVSAPGSGKTTVAAERFGYLAYLRTNDRRGVLGLSFTRAAVGELSSRISARWGRPAVGLPNLVTTFDDLHVRVLHHLMSLGLVRWPGGHTTLTVLDEYRGMRGFRFREPGSYKRIAACNASTGLVYSHVRRVPKNEYGFGSKDDHNVALASGYCSHEDVRWVLRSAVSTVVGVEDAIKAWLGSNFRHIVIDEIYDADGLDLWTALAAGQAGTEITVVGDPWQALYGWRGATPEKVQKLLDGLPFHEYQQPESFRFRGSQMPELARQLRASEPVTVPRRTSDGIDVALARKWSELWNVGDNILPLGFRTIQNATDAMLNLLLDEVTRRKLGRDSFGKQTACVYLRLDPVELGSVQAGALDLVLQAMLAGESAADVLELLRDTAHHLGVSRRPTRLRKMGEPIRQAEVDALRVRLQRDDLVPGLTVHQAKGRQWERVGVALSARDEAMLASGLQPLVEDHCVLYVALTRAQESCVALGDPGELQLGESAEP